MFVLLKTVNFQDTYILKNIENWDVNKFYILF